MEYRNVHIACSLTTNLVFLHAKHIPPEDMWTALPIRQVFDRDNFCWNLLWQIKLGVQVLIPDWPWDYVFQCRVNFAQNIQSNSCLFNYLLPNMYMYMYTCTCHVAGHLVSSIPNALLIGTGHSLCDAVGVPAAGSKQSFNGRVKNRSRLTHYWKLSKTPIKVGVTRLELWNYWYMWIPVMWAENSWNMSSYDAIKRKKMGFQPVRVKAWLGILSQDR